MRLKSLRKKIREQRGSSLIFLLIIMSGIISLTIVYVQAANKVTNTAYSNEVLFLSARSVLSEFDTDLLNEYGLFAFAGTESKVAEKMEDYSEYSFKNKESLKLKKLEAMLSDYSLLNTDVFRDEVLSAVKFELARKLIDEKGFNSGSGEVDKSGTRVLRNHKIIDQLPSERMGENGSLWKSVKSGLSDIDKVFEKTGENYLLNLYCLTKFKSAQNQDIDRNTFFNYEIEYILEGGLSDKENREDFRNELLLLRNAVNVIFIYSSPKKMEEVLAAAEIIAPGVGGLIVQAMIVEAWALLEAENDLQLLEHGKKVPLYKTEDTWAVDIESVIENKEAEYIDTKSKTGFDYQDYLQVFLFFLDDTTKLMRMMDLIQINMQGNYSGSFLIRDHNTGFELEADVNGKTFKANHSY